MKKMKAKLIKVDDVYRLVEVTKHGNSIIGTTDLDYQKSWSDRCQKLSLKNCQAVERGYDLDELANDFIRCPEDMRTLSEDREINSFKKGFQKALELMGDKKFTEEDIHQALHLMNNMKRIPITGKALDIITKIEEQRSEIIQSLQQNEWEVEIEMEEVIGNLHETHHTNPTLSFPKQPIAYGEKPKLDADGCLILKRV